MKYDIANIVSDTSLKGKKFWVCDYRKDSTNKKANRSVEPTEIMIVTNDDFDNAGIPLPRIYYSLVGFAKLDKNGNPKLKQLIPPYDTTGYRSNPGIGVNVFDNEDECNTFYNEQVQTVVDMYNSHLSTIVSNLTNERDLIIKLLK